LKQILFRFRPKQVQLNFLNFLWFRLPLGDLFV
jgi:hypothetical protein